MRLVLVVPGVLVHRGDALARSDVLARLAAHSHVRREDDLDTALLAALGVDLPAAPLAALGAGLDVGTRWFARADPVSMSVGQGDARIHARVDDLDADETRALASLLTSHFAGDGVAFTAARGNTWFASGERAFDLATTPLDAALDRPLRELLPTGADAPRWRRWLTEAQMLLHEHPLANRGHPVNAIWISQAGNLPDSPRIPGLRVYAAAGRAADVVRGLARLARCEARAPSLDSALHGDEDSVLVIEPAETPSALEHAATKYLGPALDALDGKRIDALDVAMDGPGRAGLWQASRLGWLQRLKARDTRFDAAAVESQ